MQVGDLVYMPHFGEYGAGGSMQVGDLVTTLSGHKMGIITAQIGVVDRWWIEWLGGESYAMNGHKLRVVSCK